MRNRLKRPISSLSLLLMLGACAHAENYRWSDMSEPKFPSNLAPTDIPKTPKFGSWETPAVSVYSFSTPSSAPGDAGLRDLSDRGQAAYIAALTATGAKPDDIRDALAKPIKAKVPAEEVTATLEGSYKRTLVANVTKGWNAKPGDRLVWTWVYVEPINFVFDGYTIVATDNQVLNIENVTNATTASLTGQLGRTTADTTGSSTVGTPTSNTLSNLLGSSAGISGTVGNTYTTTASINQQYVKLGADIVPEGLRIYRESERNLDVAGNTLIALTMRIDPTRLEQAGFSKTFRVTKLKLLDDNNAMVDPNAATLEAAINKAPPRCDLKARVTLFYQFRVPTNDTRRSYMEGQQDAEYTTGKSAPTDVVIVPEGEVTKPTWVVYPGANKEVPIWARNAFDQKFPLEFSSYEQADAFAAWLDAHQKHFTGKSDVAIGKAGLKVWSGVVGNPIYAGPYTATPYRVKPDVLDNQCKAILTAGLAGGAGNGTNLAAPPAPTPK